MITLIHTVSEYSGLDFHETLDLPVDMFLLMYKQAVIANLNRTPEGKEYLAKCKRMSNTAVDMDAVNAFQNDIRM